MELIIGLVTQFIWPIALVILGLFGFVAYGAKKKADGRAQERDRAQAARDKAARDAARTRDTAAAKPIDQQRRDVERWER